METCPNGYRIIVVILMKRPVTSSPFGTIVGNHCAEPLSGVVVGVIKVAGHHLKGTGFPIEPHVEICMKNNLTRKLTPNKNRTALRYACSLRRIVVIAHCIPHGL